MDEQVRKRLESLGYVSGRVAEEFEFDQKKGDPKDLIDLHEAVEKTHHLIAQKKFGEARKLCQDQLLRHDDYYGLYRLLGEICFEEGDKQKAQTYILESLRLNPDQLGLHFNLAMLLAEQGKYDDAISHLKEALRLNPNQILAHNNLALLLYQTGNIDEAVKHWQLSLRLRPDQPQIKDRIAAALAQKQKERLE